jgi:hypothetical protein
VVPRPDSTSALSYSVPAIEAMLAADDCRCLLRGPREALNKAVAEAGRRHLAYTHRLRVTARDMYLACRRGEYTRASLMVGGKMASKRTGGAPGSVGAASSLRALATIGASRATFGVDRRRASAASDVDNRRRPSTSGSMLSSGAATEHAHPGTAPAGADESAAVIAAGLGSLQVRL